MRIGLVIKRFDPRRGGAEQATFQLAEQLVSRGHEVHVVARRFADQARRLPIVTHPVEQATSRLGFAEAAEARLRWLALDVVHDMGAGWYGDLFQPHGGSSIAVERQKLLSVPSWLRPLKRACDVATPRHRELKRLVERQYADDGRLLVALSRMTARHFQEYHGVDPSRIRLIYNGIDTERFSPEHRGRYRTDVRRQLGVDDATTVLLVVAHNFRLKGVSTLLRAMDRLTARREPVHLVVVGGKPPRRYVRWARRLRLGDRVTFTGAVDDAVPLYAAADVYVHPTFFDNCSLVVLEALAAGLPVITSRFNGAGELLTEGTEGHVLADPANVDELLWRLEPLLDAAHRRPMGEAARRLALNHTMAAHVDQIVNLYDEVARSRGTSARAA